MTVGELITRNLGPSLGWVLFGALSMWLVRALMSGLLHPRVIVEDGQRREEAWRLIAEQRERANDDQRKTIDTLAAQVAELTESSHIAVGLLQAMRDAAAQQGGRDVVA